MSDLEFQRALSPDQMREALSLLDNALRAQPEQLQVEELRQTEVVDPEAEQASTATATPTGLPAGEDAQRKKHLSPVVVFYALGIAAAAALTLLSWSERTLAPPAQPGNAGGQLANPQPAQQVKTASSLSDQNSHGSEQRNSMPELATSSPVDQGSRSAVQTATVTPVATNQGWWGEPASRKPKGVLRHTSAVRVAPAKSRFSRRHWRLLAEINGAECFHAACLPLQKRRAFYEPPRTTTQ